MTWAIMGVEVPIVSFAVARMPEVAANLAALGAAISIAWLSETLIVNMTASSLRLAEDRDSYRAMRRYAFALAAVSLFVNLGLILSPALDWLLSSVIGMERSLADLTFKAYVWLAFWPALIGLRRFYQGQVIRHGQTRRIAYGTALRLVALSAVAAIGATTGGLSGAEVGAIALMAGVALEAVAARAMAGCAIQATLAREPSPPALTFIDFWRFYWPLTVMMGLNLAVGALATAGLAKAHDAAIALAAFPVAHGLNFIFRAIGTSFQEAAIALLGRSERNALALKRFAISLGLAMTAILLAMALTPLSGWIFKTFMGLPDALQAPTTAAFAMFVPYPAVTLWFVWSRALLTHRRNTRPIAIATVVETAALAGILGVCIWAAEMDGAVAAALAMVTSRIVANLWLLRST